MEWFDAPLILALFAIAFQASMRDGGFREVTTVEIDHRHRAVMGIRA